MPIDGVLGVISVVEMIIDMKIIKWDQIDEYLKRWLIFFFLDIYLLGLIAVLVPYFYHSAELIPIF